MCCKNLACEMKLKEEVGLSSRCMPFEQEHLSDVCPCCGKPASKMCYWGVAYKAAPQSEPDQMKSSFPVQRESCFFVSAY